MKNIYSNDDSSKENQTIKVQIDQFLAKVKSLYQEKTNEDKLREFEIALQEISKLTATANFGEKELTIIKKYVDELTENNKRLTFSNTAFKIFRLIDIIIQLL